MQSVMPRPAMNLANSPVLQLEKDGNSDQQSLFSPGCDRLGVSIRVKMTGGNTISHMNLINFPADFGENKDLLRCNASVWQDILEGNA